MNDIFCIVVGMDGSDQARRALDWAVTEATARWRGGQPAGVEIVAAWQYDTLVAPIGAYLAGVPDPDADARNNIAAALATVAPHAGVTVTGIAVEGAAGDVLSRAADGADLLVLGSHGHRHMHHAVLGSVAETCIRDAICPVVVIPLSRSSSTSRAHEDLQTAVG